MIIIPLAMKWLMISHIFPVYQNRWEIKTREWKLQINQWTSLNTLASNCPKVWLNFFNTSCFYMDFPDLSTIIVSLLPARPIKIRQELHRPLAVTLLNRRMTYGYMRHVNVMLGYLDLGSSEFLMCLVHIVCSFGDEIIAKMFKPSCSCLCNC